MKKLLSILGAITLTGVGATSVVACGSPLGEGGEEFPPVEAKPEDILDLLKADVSKQVQSHLLNNNNIFKLQTDLANENYTFFTESKILEYAGKVSETDKFVKVQVDESDNLNLLNDLGQILKINDLKNQLEELKKDAYFGYSMYLAGLDSNTTILKDITLSDNGFEIKKTKDGTSHQIRINFDLNWVYDQNGIQNEIIRSNTFMFTTTNSQELNDYITNFNDNYKNEILKNKNSAARLDESDLKRSLLESEKYTAYSELQESDITSWYSGSEDLKTEIQTIFSTLNNNDTYKLNFNESRASLNRYFDFFDNSTVPLVDIGRNAYTDAIYSYIQSQVLGANSYVPSGFSFSQVKDENDLLYLAMCQFLYSSVDATIGDRGILSPYGQNYLSELTYKNLFNMLKESGYDLGNYNDYKNNSFQNDWNNVWSMGYIVINNVELTFGETTITLPSLNIPYTYSIKDLVSVGSGNVNSKDQSYTIEKLVKIMEFWTKQVVELYGFMSTRNEEGALSSIIKISKSSDLYKALDNPLLIPNKNSISKFELQNAITSVVSVLGKQLKVDFDFFIELQNMTMSDNDLWITSRKLGTARHIYIKLGFFNFYLYSTFSKETAEIQLAYDKNLAVMTFVD